MDTMTFVSKKLSISNTDAYKLIHILGPERAVNLCYVNHEPCDTNNTPDGPERELKALKARFGTVVAELQRQNVADIRAMSGLKRAVQERNDEIDRIRGLFDFYKPKP